MPLTEEMIVGEAINLPCSSRSCLLIDWTTDGAHGGKGNTVEKLGWGGERNFVTKFKVKQIVPVVMIRSYLNFT